MIGLGIAFNPCCKCDEKSKCNICELTYRRNGQPVHHADVVEVRHGYWEKVTELKNDTVCGNGVNIQYKICSNCKYPMGVTDNIYCGHCGAKMDGGRSKQK